MVFRILLNFTADNTCRPTAPMRRPQSQPRQRLKWRLRFNASVLRPWRQTLESLM